MRIITFFAALLLTVHLTTAQVHKFPPQVVLIGIGEKNQTFDESRYPDLKFYYTPQLVKEGEQITGTPEFVKKLWNNKNFKNGFMLFDKNGTCVTMGYRILSQKDIGARMCADKKTLADHLKTYVKKGKTGKVSSKEMKFKKSDFLVGHPIPEFDVKTASGETVSIDSITKSEKPVLLVFFYIPKNADLNAGKQNMSKKSGKGFLKEMKKGAAGAKHQRLFIELEGQLFQYDARQK